MSKRTQRVSMEIHRILSDVLLRGLPDDRVTPISIISVDCSPDLRQAKVLFVPMGGLGNVVGIMEGLKESGGFINREVAKKLKMKYSPRLTFVQDEHFFENVDFIEELVQRQDSELDSEG